MGGVSTSLNVAAALGSPRLTVRARDAIEDLMIPVLRDWNEELVQTWPVLTGLSLRGWQSIFVWPLWDLFNAVDYAEWVHQSGDSTGAAHRHLFAKARSLLRKALPAMRAVVRADVAPTLGLGAPAVLGLRPGAEQLGLGLAGRPRVDIAAGLRRVQQSRERARLRASVRPLPSDSWWLRLLSAVARALALSSPTELNRARQRAQRARR